MCFVCYVPNYFIGFLSHGYHVFMNLKRMNRMGAGNYGLKDKKVEEQTPDKFWNGEINDLECRDLCKVFGITIEKLLR